MAPSRGLTLVNDAMHQEPEEPIHLKAHDRGTWRPSLSSGPLPNGADTGWPSCTQPLFLHHQTAGSDRSNCLLTSLNSPPVGLSLRPLCFVFRFTAPKKSPPRLP